MRVDDRGYRLNVGMVLLNTRSQVFWGRRLGHDAWQFPQGGLAEGETPRQALYRELHEEVGLTPDQVDLVAESKRWHDYQLPPQYTRQRAAHKLIGQTQRWFLLRLLVDDDAIDLARFTCPEFDAWRWVDYWVPVKEVIFFKQAVYQAVLTEFTTLAQGHGVDG